MAVRPIDANAMLNELRPVGFEAEHSAVLLSDVSKMMREWVERQPTLTPPNEWISTEDRKPKFPNQTCNEIMVIAYIKNGYVMPMVYTRGQVGDEKSEVWLYPWDKIYVGPEITHWMPLPKPPKGGLKNETNRR